MKLIIKKIIFVGASIPNLYGAKQLLNKGYKVIVYEKNSNINNEQIRRLKTSFLNELGYNVKVNEDNIYLKLSKLKKFLSKNIKIIFNSHLKIDLEKEIIKLNGEELTFDYLIINTEHNKIKFNSKNIFTYNYSVIQNSNHFAGNSLISSIEKMKNIIEKIKK